jgi:hypothetical protein
MFLHPTGGTLGANTEFVVSPRFSAPREDKREFFSKIFNRLITTWRKLALDEKSLEMTKGGL